jgi:DNA-binding MarR family transcriptional regulator
MMERPMERAMGVGMDGAEAQPGSLITPLGLVEGDVLTYLEEHGATSVRRLIRALDWPAPMVLMAVGALVRERLVRAVQHDLEVIVYRWD